MKLTDDNEAQLRDDVLNMLIDDKLKFIEVKRLAPGLIEAGTQQAREMVDDTYKTDTKSSGQNLRELGLDRQIIEQKVSADLIWSTLLRDRHKNQFDNADKLANQALARIKDDLRLRCAYLKLFWHQQKTDPQVIMEVAQQ